MDPLVPALFPDEFKTTAIYKNRLADKERIEATLGLSEQGDEATRFQTPRGTEFAIGYVRIVYGDHGPYLEFRREQIICPLRPKFKTPLPANAYYEWLVPEDGSGIKVYDQKRDVKNLKSPPKGGHSGRLEEGYADYIPGMIYVNPYDLQATRPSAGT